MPETPITAGSQPPDAATSTPTDIRAPSRLSPPQDGQVFLSLPQICRRYAVHRATVYRWMDQRGFPRPLHISSACARVPLDEIEKWEQTQRRSRG